MDLATVDKLLTTTRSVRKRLDFTRPVEPEVLQHCLDIAIQAPTGGDIPRYHFLIITDSAIQAELAALYRTAMADYLAGRVRIDRPVARHEARFHDSLRYLADHLHEAPVLIQTCVEARSLRGQGTGWEFANIFPAAWSLPHAGAPGAGPGGGVDHHLGHVSRTGSCRIVGAAGGDSPSRADSRGVLHGSGLQTRAAHPGP